MEDVLLPLIICSILFIGLPWLVFHYVTKWKQSATITGARREIARRPVRPGAAARRPALLDRADHDRGEPELASALPAGRHRAHRGRVERCPQPQPAAASGPENKTMAYQPPSRTRFYRDKRNGKFMGICAGIADYTGFDVTLVRIGMIAAVFLSSGSILPVYFIAGMVAPDRPRELDTTDVEDQDFWRSVRQSPPDRPRHPLAAQGHRSPPGRRRKLRDHREPLARPRNRAAALKFPSRRARWTLQH